MANYSIVKETIGALVQTHEGLLVSVLERLP
jgi:hypothetical protein